ncbi:signal peptidase I [Candidatus Falkowbacteria bacterium]|nr:signal peptidase I [Candidatus Falkowbacteria bacterium]
MPFVTRYSEPKLTPAQKAIHFVWDLLKVVCVSLAIIIPVRYFLIQPFYVKGASMEPSFFDHEYLIIDEIGYRFGEPKRGDIVVFKYPKDPSLYFIKRIIGLPGETVEIADSKVYIHPAEPGAPKFILDEENYLSSEVNTFGNKTWVLGADDYYVLGDNRESSLDSRTFGPVFRELIVGKVWFRGWPVARVGLFPSVKYE